MSSVDELLRDIKKLKDASDHLLSESKKALDQYRDEDGKLEGAYEPNFMAGYLYGVQEVRLFLSSLLQSILDKERKAMEELTPQEAGYLAELAELQINDLVETGVKPRIEVTPGEAEEIRILSTAVEKLYKIIDPRVG